MLQTPDQGLGSIGVQLPLGQGLLIDARRASVLQARLMQDLLEAERFLIVNKLLLQVNKDYWDWSYGFQRVRLTEEGVRLAEIRYEAIRYKVILGELPSMDSVEALLEVQNRQNILVQARIDYSNSTFQLSNHLWTNDGLPAEITPSMIPAFSDADSVGVRPLVQWLDSADARHPELVKAETKIGQLEVEKRWAAERLRPRIQLDYNLYSYDGKGFSEAGFMTPYWSDNMKLGLSFSTSLFLREERGKYGLARLKVQQARYEQQRLRRDIYNQVRAAYNESELLSAQLEIQTGQVRSAEQLLEAEQSRFNEGEGSLFLLNNRENVLINGRIRQAECRSKLAKSRATVRWAAGSLLSP
jgi:outer membrane protein TolC